MESEKFVQNGEIPNSSSSRTTSESISLPIIYQSHHHHQQQRKRSRSIIRSQGYLQEHHKRRVLDRDGKLNVFVSNVPKKSLRYLRDIGNTLIHIRWRWILLSLFITNSVCYIIFAFMWMGIALWNGDKETPNLQERCVIGTVNFTGYLLLSIESLTTIGSGIIYPTDHCHGGWIILTLHHMVMITIEGGLVTAIYTKLSRPHQRTRLENFSKKAVICLRDDKLCLVFRIRDPVKKYWAKTDIRVYLRRKKIYKEGDSHPNYLAPLKIQYYGEFLWPLDIVHVLDENSPLWDISAKDLITEELEVLVIIEGESFTTGQPSQTQMSYMNSEILWGYRFVSCLNYDEDEEAFIADEKKFHAIYPTDIPLCSASRLQQVLEDISSISSDIHSL